MSDSVSVDVRERVTVVSLARPEKANALSGEMADGIRDAVHRAAAEGARALVLRGEGRHFCAGFDFGDFERLTDGDLALRFLQVEEMLQAVFHAPMPVLALVQGRAVGAGADLAAAAMRVVAAPGVRFQMPGPRFGVVLGTRRLAYRIGPVAARQIQIESRPVADDEARALGLVDALVPAEDWPAEIDRFAESYTQLGASVTAALADVTRPDTRDADMAALARSVAVPGLKERIAAFRAAAARR
ncbi:MAG: enoyl-CoA hydratase/isomerase family protein [Alphaproteobacteria bacterium]|nr:enoyl-CoA hydratase/isomerase family protein [Alphaproteobacteria bacterium]MCB9929225.1 enoyl-CoA hydratase/isomerase family protein [Alphaproteobacteria bacterium]